MKRHTISKGLNLPMSGDPIQLIESGGKTSTVAVVAHDFVGMKPKMLVDVGDKVKRGQKLFEDRKTPGVFFTAPGAGEVAAINRGAKRALQTVVIRLTPTEADGKPTVTDYQPFQSYSGDDPSKLSRDKIRDLLVESGQWVAFRTRPFSRVPSPESEPPAAIFVTAHDTNPHAPNVETVLRAGRESDFGRGLQAVSKLTDGPMYVCTGADASINLPSIPNLQHEGFQGPHPAGTVGLHIHTLSPVGRHKTVWHVHYQDVVNIGRLFTNGQLDVERVISIAGPAVKNPRLIKTRVGACIDELVSSELQEGENRVISGSVLSGRTAMGREQGYLGRFHLQVSALREGRTREFMGWLTPGPDKFSTAPIYVSSLMEGKSFDMTTSTNGSPRAMVPIGMYERVMPMDILPTFLLRSLVSGDLERAEQLGALELDEEDLALCTFVCPGKYEYGPHLRRVLTTIEKEG